VSQALFGETLRILEVQDTWSYVRLDGDGYPGWIHTASVFACSAQQVEAWQAALNGMVIADFMPYVQLNGPTPAGRGAPAGHTAGLLPFGARIPVIEWADDWIRFVLPDGSICSADRHAALPLNECPQPTSHGIQRALDQVRRFVGVPYLWGGRSPFGFDCSGLAQAFYAIFGIQIPRDADQQFLAGQVVQGTPQPGDLLFFGEEDEEKPGEMFAHITHVGISLGGDALIHSNGSDWGISYNSINPDRPAYRAYLREHLAGVRRFW
jgi:cell wall-associated NlpC family hydrolase